MKKRYIYIPLLLMLPLYASAQEYQSQFIRRQPRNIASQKAAYAQMKQDAQLTQAQEAQLQTSLDTAAACCSNSNLPDFKPKQTKLSPLHAEVDISAFATFGKHAPHHGGFAQNIALGYNSAISRDVKLWVDAGAYLNNMFYGGDNYRDLGLYGTLGYSPNEHWDVYVYGQLTITNNYRNHWANRWGYSPMYGRMAGYPFGPVSSWMDSNFINRQAGANVIGAGATYHINKSMSIGINVDVAWYDHPMIR